jgi:Peptidase family M48
MTFFLGRARGVWAAVLGHEMGHALILHPDSWAGFENELRRECDQAQAECARAWDGRPLLGFSSSDGVFNANHAKSREYAADYIAMMLMAAAGYNPEYVLTLDRWMIGSVADPPRLTEFLDSHPRWKEREVRTRQEIAPARAIFNQRWPDAAKSPGGIAVGRGQLGRVQASFNTGRTELTIQAPITVRQAAGVEVRVVCVFLGSKTMVESSVPEFRAPDGALELNTSFPGSASDSRVVTFHLPLSAMANPQPRLRMLVFLMAGDMVLDRAYLPIHLQQ